MRYLVHTTLFFVLLFLFFCQNAFSQCNNWNIATVNIKPSHCIANGSFSMQLSGADISNLNNIKYSIPLTPLGFFVQANSSPDFANIPAGTYTVKVEANCGAGTVSKTTTVVVGGSYITPALLAKQFRGSFSCGSYGQIQATMSGSSYPYSVQILSHPPAYTGPVIFITGEKDTLIDNLPAGNYTLQMVDTCGNATPTQTVTINSLNPSAIPIDNGGFSAVGNSCNIFRLFKPSISMTSDPKWQGYFMADSLFEVAYSINGGTNISAFEKMDHNFFTVTLPNGKTYKDLYGTNYTFYIKPPCGSMFQLQGLFPAISVQVIKSPQCSSGFTTTVNLSGTLICRPLIVSLKDVNTNIVYGPYSSNNYSITTPLLPYGNYDVTYTTGDGFTGSSSIYASVPSANPYSVIYQAGKEGLNNYISYFVFFYSGGIFPNGNIKLLAGPPGYSYNANVSGGSTGQYVYSNQAPPTSSNALFVPGTYTWQIKDACGTYIVTVKVLLQDVYSYTLNLNNRQKTCNGLKVYPAGSCSYKGSTNWPVYFKILDGPPGFNSAVVPTGNAITLTTGGTYVIGISASPDDVYSYGNYPNAYQVTDTIVYDYQPLTVDVNNTQGFLCIGATAGQGQIGISGKGGAPYSVPAQHYKYFLAAAGNGVSGPYIANNTTGHFSGMGMNANDVFDLKIEDSCGAFVTHQVKILDLSTVQLATAGSPDICVGETLSLYALPLPGATYSWTGPNGFSSNLKSPVIPNAGMAAGGQYSVTITTIYCSVPVSATVNVVMHPVPGKASVSVNCVDTTAVLTASNVIGADYQWYKDGNILLGETKTIYTVTQAGAYVVRTVFAATGCSTASDSVFFTAPPGTIDTPSITATKYILCTGDTVQLSAQTKYPAIYYQWYRNGMAITGATSKTLSTPQEGDYTVETSTGPCAKAISPIATLQRMVPIAVIQPLGDTVFCEGGEVVLFGNGGTGLSYTWMVDGNIIGNASGNIYRASQPGVYTLEVYNGHCSAISNPITIIVNEHPVAAITPEGEAYICEGDRVQLVTPPGTAYYYTWLKDDVVIPGETANTYTASVSGVYTVIVDNGKCPDDTSVTRVYVVPYPAAGMVVDGPVEFCEGLTTILKVPYQVNCTYKWYNNGAQIPGAENADYTVTVSGRYKAAVNNHNCVTESQEIDIMVHPKPMPRITRRDKMLGTGIYQFYQWYMNSEMLNGATRQEYEVPQPGYYTVMVTDTNGCSGISDTADIVSLDEGCIVRVPSAFSPNGDGKNDVFRLVGFEEYDVLEFRVVNRWGKTVFETTGEGAGWDGRWNNTPQEIGSYFYFVKYKCNSESRERMKKGEVSLIR